MPQYDSDGEPDKLAVVMGVWKGLAQVFATRFKQKPPALATPLNNIGTQRAAGSAVPPPEHSLSATHALQAPTLPIVVFVQAFVAGLHDLPPHAVSSAAVHCTQAPAFVSHTVLPAMCEQSSLLVHLTQVPVPSHFAATAVEQSVGARHSTQALATVSHFFFEPVQSVP